MSSHHVVKEKQEPALIIANGQACSWDLLSNLLEWSPFTIVLDSAMERVMDLEISVDVLLGDWDNGYDPNKWLNKRPNLKIINALNQDKTDLQKAMEYLIEEKHEAVNIVWASGKRLDHTMQNLVGLMPYNKAINWRILDDYSLVYPIKPGFKKYFDTDFKLSLFPIPKVVGLTTKNLVWNLENATLELPETSSSNKVESNNLVEIDFKSGSLLLMECKD